MVYLISVPSSIFSSLYHILFSSLLFIVQELKRVLIHNAAGKSWKETINQFSHLTPAEKKAYHGRSKHTAGAFKSDLHVKYDGKKKPIDIKGLPETIDWRTKGVMTTVKDQGHCGSCYANAATAQIESAAAIASGLLFDLSLEQGAFCTENPHSCGGTGGCAGGTAEVVFDAVAKSGGMFESFQYPYSGYYGNDSACALPTTVSPKVSITGYTKLPENEYAPLMQAVATEGPIAISVDASVWHAYHSGIFSGCDQQNPDIDHAVLLAGYGFEPNGQKYWLVRNSWSASWGEAGFIRLSREDQEEILCGIDKTPEDGSACTGETDPVKVCGTCGILFDTSYVTGADIVA